MTATHLVRFPAGSRLQAPGGSRGSRGAPGAPGAPGRLQGGSRGLQGAGWRPFFPSTQGRAVPHVLGTPAAHVGPLQEQVGQPVQAHAGGEGAEQTVDAAQDDADGPAEAQQDHQPHDAPATRAARTSGEQQARVDQQPRTDDIRRAERNAHKAVRYSRRTRRALRNTLGATSSGLSCSMGVSLSSSFSFSFVLPFPSSSSSSCSVGPDASS
ncbi:hypothetical protein CRUP_035050 [Coryphaenoides rupestris]|nr:hypothetical protein CRUP_035050 [Coryphaenoides rupestris]